MDVIGIAELLKFPLALILVLALMGGLALLLKKLGYGQMNMARGTKRLKIIEALPVDARRRLILIQRDDKQHLIMSGPSGDTLIEQDITGRSVSDEKTV